MALEWVIVYTYSYSKLSVCLSTSITCGIVEEFLAVIAVYCSAIIALLHLIGPPFDPI